MKREETREWKARAKAAEGRLKEATSTPSLNTLSAVEFVQAKAIADAKQKGLSDKYKAEFEAAEKAEESLGAEMKINLQLQSAQVPHRGQQGEGQLPPKERGHQPGPTPPQELQLQLHRRSRPRPPRPAP